MLVTFMRENETASWKGFAVPADSHGDAKITSFLKEASLQKGSDGTHREADQYMRSTIFSRLDRSLGGKQVNLRS